MSEYSQPGLLALTQAFPDVDRDLVQLALLGPTEILSPDVDEALRRKYGIYAPKADNRSLLFYGNVMIGVILADQFRAIYRLNLTAAQLQTAEASIARLTTTSVRVGADQEVCTRMGSAKQLSRFAGALGSRVPYGVPPGAFPSSPRMAFGETNPFAMPAAVPAPVGSSPSFDCGVSLSALVGALFYQYGIEATPKIAAWFKSVVHIEQLLTNYNALTLPAEAPATVAPWKSIIKPISANNLTEFSQAVETQTGGVTKLATVPVPGQDLLGVGLLNTANKTVLPLANIPVPGLSAYKLGQPIQINASAQIQAALRALGLWI